MSLGFRVLTRPETSGRPRLSDDFMTLVAFGSIDPPDTGELRQLETRLGRDLGPLRSVAFDRAERVWHRAVIWLPWAFALAEELDARASALAGVPAHYVDGFADATAVRAFAAELRDLAEWLRDEGIEELCFAAADP
ncbi:MAG: hypothetical protein EP330_19715 [Deltaproteobacteria bacterium]|nr:MAG: hypothetical protein EP330_19715 [Deltaproteobacteria bacterium]